MEELVRRTQADIVAGLEVFEDAKFRHDSWDRPGGGGGTSCVLQDGKTFEKAGVNVSVVHGVLPEEAQKSMGGGTGYKGNDPSFFATGISLVLHPHNPFAPTVHANYRYFERGDGSEEGSWWFGGGADLTPSYLFEDDAKHFHQVHKDACDKHDVAYYPRFKKWCDEYFHIKHRGEARGIGGIFFDNLNQGSKEELFGFVSDCAASFLPAYAPIVEQRKDHDFQEAHKRWQSLRRGRYVEFNLVYDRGTVFGLKTNGRIESILMSLPVHARWEYMAEPDAGSPEAELTEVLREPLAWV